MGMETALPCRHIHKMTYDKTRWKKADGQIGNDGQDDFRENVVESLYVVVTIEL